MRYKEFFPKVNLLFDEKIRYEYDLNEDSVVFDLGAYSGSFIEGIYNKYHCNIYAFEPLPSIFEKTKRKFNNNKIKLFNFGLLNRNFETKMKNQGMSSSLFSVHNEGEKIIIKDINEVVSGFDRIDLIKINIEGGEYDLLEHILNNGDISIYKNIQIQYHTANDKRQNCYANAKKLIKKITNELHKTHNLKWWFPIWESWEIK